MKPTCQICGRGGDGGRQNVNVVGMWLLLAETGRAKRSDLRTEGHPAASAVSFCVECVRGIKRIPFSDLPADEAVIPF